LDFTQVQLANVALGEQGFVLNGESASDYSGYRVDFAGDVNGDGLADLIVGAPQATDAPGIGPGKSYVVFGRSDGVVSDLSDVASGVGGFVIHGESGSGSSGSSVAAAGDVNGDGLADLIIGAPHVDDDTGRAYVVYGRSAGSAVALSDVAQGVGGFVIHGQSADDRSGGWVGSAGDFNGDGLSDLIVGANRADDGADPSVGRSYVIFGTTQGAAVQLSDIAAGNGGVVVIGESVQDWSGRISAAGDVNGDGLADVIIGAPLADANSVTDAGRSYVLFGRTEGGVVQASYIAAGTAGGFVIDGEAAEDRSGWRVTAAGDVNGDGLADLFVGARYADVGGQVDAGKSYVVFGKTGSATVDLTSIAAGNGGGFAINGWSADDMAAAVAAAGDINGDGLMDLIVGGYGADADGRVDAGRSFVVFGRTGSQVVELSDVAAGQGGFVIAGECASDFSGRFVTGGGDLNGDGFADLVIGARLADPEGLESAGRTYILFGGQQFTTTVDFLGTTGNDTLNGTSTTTNLSETFAGGAGHDTVYGGGGADVMMGGAGDDVFVLNADNVSKLIAGVTDDRLARVDGGGGMDLVQIDGSGVVLDLTQIANVGAGTPDGLSRMEGIEKIDLTGSGHNTLKITAADVLDMSGMNLWNVDGDAAVADALSQVMVMGNAGDTVDLADSGWARRGTDFNHGGIDYQVWTDEAQRAQLLIAPNVTVLGGS
jgi:hypothetical protein